MLDVSWLCLGSMRSQRSTWTKPSLIPRNNIWKHFPSGVGSSWKHLQSQTERANGRRRRTISILFWHCMLQTNFTSFLVKIVFSFLFSFILHNFDECFIWMLMQKPETPWRSARTGQGVRRIPRLSKIHRRAQRNPLFQSKLDPIFDWENEDYRLPSRLGPSNGKREPVRGVSELPLQNIIKTTFHTLLIWFELIRILSIDSNNLEAFRHKILYSLCREGDFKETKKGLDLFFLLCKKNEPRNAPYFNENGRLFSQLVRISKQMMNKLELTMPISHVFVECFVGKFQQGHPGKMSGFCPFCSRIGSREWRVRGGYGTDFSTDEAVQGSTCSVSSSLQYEPCLPSSAVWTHHLSIAQGRNWPCSPTVTISSGLEQFRWDIPRIVLPQCRLGHPGAPVIGNHLDEFEWERESTYSFHPKVST